MLYLLFFLLLFQCFFLLHLWRPDCQQRQLVLSCPYKRKTVNTAFFEDTQLRHLLGRISFGARKFFILHSLKAEHNDAARRLACNAHIFAVSIFKADSQCHITDPIVSILALPQIYSWPISSERVLQDSRKSVFVQSRRCCPMMHGFSMYVLDGPCAKCVPQFTYSIN